jgi:lipopolysaccharide transport system ATP-binding protein
MPLLPAGDYTVCIAVAEGHLTAHVQHHFFADALTFRCETETLRFGLVGIPMDAVEVEVRSAAEVAP